jgi:glucokinase
VVVDNNVRAMALAEAMFGAGRGGHSLIFVYGRVGVGAGFVVDGQVYHGSQAGAGEIGHTTIIPAGGMLCRCGNTGCLETLVSEAEFIRQAQILAARHPESLLAALLAGDAESPIDRIFAAAAAGDRDAERLLGESAFYLGTALANLVNTVNPDMIILGGVFAAGEGQMVPMIEETMRRRSFAGLGERTMLCATTFGRKVGVIGAAALALDAFFYQPGGGLGLTSGGIS